MNEYTISLDKVPEVESLLDSHSVDYSIVEFHSSGVAKITLLDSISDEVKDKLDILDIG